MLVCSQPGHKDAPHPRSEKVPQEVIRAERGGGGLAVPLASVLQWGAIGYPVMYVKREARQ